MLKYPARRYDLSMRLKVSPLLWLAMLYAIRHLAFLMLKKDAGGVPWITLQANAFLICTDIPAALVLLSIGHRINGHGIMKWVWSHGRALLLASYLAAMVMFTFLNWPALSNPDSYKFITACSVLALDAIVVGYLLTSRLVGDIFADLMG
ncbi:MAG: DUF2919 family protein [Nitrosomonadales bacterium]|nr:DUF2919 family protein [Nitrosomonadales bacterium]